MKSIEDHIKKDQEIISDPLANPAARRHAKEELPVSYTHLTLPTIYSV